MFQKAMYISMYLRNLAEESTNASFYWTGVVFRSSIVLRFDSTPAGNLGHMLDGEILVFYYFARGDKGRFLGRA
jgi:hypothetical protein